MVELRKSYKTKEDLFEILTRYPYVSVLEERVSDTFRIIEQDLDSPGGERSLVVFKRFNKDSNTINPYISYKIPGTNNWVYLEFSPDGLKSRGAEYDGITGILELAKKGLEIMSIFKRMNQEDRFEAESIYGGRVCDWRQYEDPIQITSDGLEETLEVISREIDQK